MIPIAEVTALNELRHTRDAIDLVRRRGYNRLPVYRGNISNVVGVLTVSTWELLDPELAERPLSDLVKPARYVSPYQTVDELLPILQKDRDHIAIVVDEFGSAVGVITLEDVLEEVVGEIDVGYDFEEYLPKRKRIFEMLGEEIYLMDSRLPISEVNEALAVDLSSKEAHTIGGLVMARLRHIPVEGEFIVEAGYRFIVDSATERTVLKLRVEPAGSM
jgi:CBS domain containing-hemolysin-like protein